MKKTVTSALCGFGLGIAVTLALGAASTVPTSARFQIAAAANYMAVIDTITGQVWAGNFNQLGPNGSALDFRNCPQSSGDFFKPKAE